MNKFLPLLFGIVIFSSCTRQMFPDNTLGQTNSKSTATGGVVYPDGSIHYPDGSVRTTDGMVWPASTTTKKTSASSKTKTGTIADDPNVTVVSKKSVSKSTGTKNTSTANSYPVYEEENSTAEVKRKTSTDVNTSARKDESGRHVRKRGESYFARK